MKTYDYFMLDNRYRLINNEWCYGSTPRHSRKGITAIFENVFGDAYRIYLKSKRGKVTAVVFKLDNLLNDAVGIYSEYLPNDSYSVYTMDKVVRNFVR